MNILIDIGHPAHVHLFKNFAQQLLLANHNVFFTCRDKEFEILLLEQYGFSYRSFGKKYKSTVGKVFGLAKFGLKEFITGLRVKPDLFLSHGSIYAAHAAFLLGKPHISLEDTYNFEQVRLYKPFTKYILTSDYDHPLKSNKVIKYSGYHELAYLHPNWFTPDKSILDDLGVTEKEQYVIMRFVSWNASHDIGHKGINLENKVKAIEAFLPCAKVFISSEGELPTELDKYRIPIRPERMHHAMAFASLIFGESATMVSEGVCLGVPGIYLDNVGRIYTQEQERLYGSCYNYTESEQDQLKAIEKGVLLLQNKNTKTEWISKREKLLQDKIDVTGFLVWFVENYPRSVQIMNENPDFQKKFK